MNGSGNLVATCVGGSDGNGRVEIGIGNATFDGPRTYIVDEAGADGSFYYRPEKDVTFVGAVIGGSCEIVLTQAPLDPVDEHAVPRGAVIAATFTCSALVGQDDRAPKTLAIESGVISATVQ